MERYVDGSNDANRALPLPQIAKTLSKKLLAGDYDALQLLANPRDLLKDGKPPTAIKAQFFKYSFSDPEELLSSGDWWRKEQMSRPYILTIDDSNDEPVRDTYFSRWILLSLSAVAVHVSFITRSSIFCLLFACCFLLALLSDYEGSVPILDRILGLIGEPGSHSLACRSAIFAIATLISSALITVFIVAKKKSLPRRGEIVHLLISFCLLLFSSR